MRVDPNRIFWARNPDVQAQEQAQEQVRGAHTDTLAMLEGRGGGDGVERPGVRRPPSYASDVSALSEDGEVERVESEVQRLFIHPSLRR